MLNTVVLPLTLLINYGDVKFFFYESQKVA